MSQLQPHLAADDSAEFALQQQVYAAVCARAHLSVAMQRPVRIPAQVVCVTGFDWQREAQRAAQLLRDTHQEPLLGEGVDVELDAAATAAAPLMPVI